MDSRDIPVWRRFWNDATAQTPLELVSPLARDEVARRLQAAIDSGWTYLGSKPVVGMVGPQAFRLRWRINYRNSFQTVLFGTLIADGRRTRLSCRTGMHPVVSVFMALWLSIVGVGTIAGVSALSDTVGGGEGREIGLVVPSLMLVFGILLVWLGRSFASGERAKLIAFLAQTVDARET